MSARSQKAAAKAKLKEVASKAMICFRRSGQVGFGELGWKAVSPTEGQAVKKAMDNAEELWAAYDDSNDDPDDEVAFWLAQLNLGRASLLRETRFLDAALGLLGEDDSRLKIISLKVEIHKVYASILDKSEAPNNRVYEHMTAAIKLLRRRSGTNNEPDIKNYERYFDKVRASREPAQTAQLVPPAAAPESVEDDTPEIEEYSAPPEADALSEANSDAGTSRFPEPDAEQLIRRYADLKRLKQEEGQSWIPTARILIAKRKASEKLDEEDDARIVARQRAYLESI